MTEGDIKIWQKKEYNIFFFDRSARFAHFGSTLNALSVNTSLSKWTGSKLIRAPGAEAVWPNADDPMEVKLVHPINSIWAFYKEFIPF